jgi:CubicO group peptidase (beta-lactamase class C family)
MYLVAGEVIHKVSGKPWAAFIKERLFNPLGMQHSYPGFKQSAAEPSHITPHYMYEDSIIKPIPLIDYRSVGAAGGVWSCADDISKWMLFLLDSAKVDGRPLLKPETYKEIFKPHSMVTESEFYPTARLTKPHFTTYGLGWFQEDYKGKTLTSTPAVLTERLPSLAWCPTMTLEYTCLLIWTTPKYATRSCTRPSTCGF